MPPLRRKEGTRGEWGLAIDLCAQTLGRKQTCSCHQPPFALLALSPWRVLQASSPFHSLSPLPLLRGLQGAEKKPLRTIYIFKRYSCIVFSSILACVYVGKSTACEPINCGVEQKSQRLSLGAFTICKLQFQLD